MFSTIGYWICVPFAWLVRLLYNLTSSYGLAIIFFTLLIKLIMLPLQLKSKKSMMRMSRMSGRMQEIQKKYANNQAKMNEEMQRLYEEEGVNPASGCLWSLIPFPILIALYSIIRQPITHFMMLSESVLEDLIQKVTAAGADMSAIVRMKDGAAVVTNGVTQLAAYGQIHLAKMISEQFPDIAQDIDGWINVNYTSFGMNLDATPSSVLSSFTFSWACIGLVLIPILAGASQFLFSYISMKQQPQQEGSAAASSKSMMYTMPLFSVFLAFQMPAALGVYWIAQSVFSVIQEVILGKFFNKKLEEEENARIAAREADRRRRVEEGIRAQKQREEPLKLTLKEKRKAAQDAKKIKKQSTNEAGRIGDRPYARGRSYQEDRYKN